MPRPSTDIEAGRAQLLDLVEDLIRQRGATTVTLAEVAAAANMSTGNIYRFFENKEALYEACAERWFAPKIAIMEEVVASDLPPREKLYQFFARRFVLMCENFDAEPVVFTSYVELGHEHFDTVRGYVDLADHYLAMVIAEVIDAGHFPGLTIDQAVSLVNLMLQPFCNPESMVRLRHSVTEEKLRRIVDAMLDGLRGDAAAAPARAAPRMHAAG